MKGGSGKVRANLPSDKTAALGLAAARRVMEAGGRIPKKYVKEFAATAPARPASAGPTLGAQQAQAKLSPARRVAFEILELVGWGKGHSDELLHGARADDLEEADRHLATALVMGVLRWQIALDAQLRGLVARPGQKVAEPVMVALRMGAFQLLHMDRIPAHAALSESVELARAAGHPHAAGMVNAVLRKVAAMKPTSQKPDAGPTDSQKIFERTAEFAERLAHPLWLVERWVQNYGRESALAICAADQEEPGPGNLFDSDASLPQIDAGSRLVAEIAAAALPQGGTRVWDCCAAPGGKTLVLAARTAGAEILASDLSARRLGHMKARMRRFPYAAEVKTVVADALALPEDLGFFDLILCDVPCSGTGTIGRNPEIRVRLGAGDLARQAERQRAILSAALMRLAPGGRLVYSTCSLEPEENEQVVEAVAEGFMRVDVAELLQRIPGLRGLRDGALQGGALRTLPGVDGCDGFYAVVLERTA